MFLLLKFDQELIHMQRKDYVNIIMFVLPKL